MVFLCLEHSFQFSSSVVSNSLWPHGLQHSMLPCPTSTPVLCSNSCPSSQWCHPTNSYSVIPFSSCLQSFPASGSFQMSQFFTSGGQNIGASASTSVLPMNIQGWFPLGLTGLISYDTEQLHSFHKLANTQNSPSQAWRQYVNHEFPDVQDGFRKGRGTRDQIASIHWITEKAREFQKNIYFCFNDYTKAFDRVDHNKLWKILKEIGIADHLTSLLRNLYAGQEATVRTWHRTTDWFQIGKGACQGCILSLYLFNFYAEYIMRNAGLDEAQAGIKIAGRNIK